MLENAYANVPFYRKKLDEAGIAARRRGLPRRRRPPALHHQDRPARPLPVRHVRAAARPDRARARLLAAPPATRPPSGYTRADIDTWGDLIARTLAAGGVKPGDLLQNAYGYGLFTGGLGLHFGAERLGCTVVPISGGNTERQLKIMRDFGATALSCTPSYAMYLGDAARDRGLRPEDLPIRVGFHGAEPWTNELRLQIEAGLGIDALDIYGLSEMGGPGRGLRVPLQGRHARQRGPLPGRDHRPRDAAAAARGRGRRAGLHDAVARGAAADPLPHPRPLQPRSPSPAPAAAPRCA